MTQDEDLHATAGKRRQDGRITAVVLSRNEADLLPDCLERLHDFDEIMVCDMQSTDETVAIARAHGARVISVPFAPIAEQVRQYALDGAATQWVLLVDADELVPSKYCEYLMKAVGEVGPQVVALQLRYDMVAFGRPLHHYFSQATKYALLQADLVDFHDVQVAHGALNFHGAVADAPAYVPSIEHYSYRSVDQTTEKLLRYARSNPQGSARHGPLRLARNVLHGVVVQGAWRDGRAGVTAATLNAFAVYYSAALEWESLGYVDPGWSPGSRRALSAAQDIAQRAGRLRRQGRSLFGAMR